MRKEIFHCIATTPDGSKLPSEWSAAGRSISSNSDQSLSPRDSNDHGSSVTGTCYRAGHLKDDGEPSFESWMSDGTQCPSVHVISPDEGTHPDHHHCDPNEGAEIEDDKSIVSQTHSDIIDRMPPPLTPPVRRAITPQAYKPLIRDQIRSASPSRITQSTSPPMEGGLTMTRGSPMLLRKNRSMII